ncbi:hypothetical protein SAMN05518863_1166 [Candidatus Pantoea symbiotica]|jgi:hypothetical protein|uniref:ImpA C-terminal domain-containing protein n=1 Tax=Candidatus Pantoea symbiotica TaxID=1884370 RepID=A0A1I4E9N7_9GAMM|nr:MULTISPECIES: hypothetical protein [Pantoea]KAJ9431457.1 hypothetical protein PMI39_003565 [Pantoea sp. YR343]MRT26324.1 hypothetical protein [Enterobacteriaceae bacterium RIT697]SFL01066.1 hypothetical protein SAMN05518863_1166 [Pantoea symbiotica]SFV07434.1 hypothetical protein SAMN05518864_1166 [Pantoea sp. YR525]
MSRKNAQSFKNPWLSMIDSVERNLINLVPAAPRAAAVSSTSIEWINCGERADAQLALLAQQPDELLQRLKSWRQAGLLSSQAIESFRQLQRLTQTSIARNQPITQLDEYQQLVGQLTPTLERINQRLNAQRDLPNGALAEDSLEVALRIAEKRRAGRSE